MSLIQFETDSNNTREIIALERIERSGIEGGKHA